MTWRLYIVPINKIDYGDGTEFAAPKYFFGRLTDGLPGMEGVQWAWERFVRESHGIIAADVSDPQHALVNAQTDVIVIPALDNTIQNATVRNRVRNILEAGNIPGTWVTIGMTYRQIVRTVLNIWGFANRYVSKGGKIFAGGITLDTTWSQIPALAQQRLRDTADEFGLDYSAVTPTTTIRQILKGMADQFGDIEYQIGGMVI
jgi:hypothetical protein